MTQVEAIYENGVLRPLSPLELEEHQQVTVMIHPSKPSRNSRLAWLDELREHRRRLQEKYGFFPDSTQSIAEDRQRDI